MRTSPHPLCTVTLLALALVSTAPIASALDVEERLFDSNGVQIRYVVQGQGEPLVLVHGFSASAETNWMMPGIFGKLADAFQVIAIDARGHGKSGKPHDPQEYGPKMAEDVVHLLDHLGIEKAHVGGYSMGGFITMQLIARHPERLLSAIVGAAGWSREGDDRSMLDTLADSLEQGKGITPLLEALQPADAPPMAPEQVEMVNQMVMQANDQLALAAVIRGMAGLTVSEEALRQNRVPTLAIIGSRDPLKEGVDAMVPVMQSLEVKVIEGGDHLTTLMNPEYSDQFTRGVLDFLIALCKCA